MSGTIIPGQTLVPTPTNRLTIPYADRVFTQNGFLTREAYQFLQRLAQSVGATITNDDSIITVVNTIVADLTTIEAEIAVLQAEVAEIEQELTLLPGPLPLYPAPVPIQNSDTAAVIPPLPPFSPGLNPTPPVPRPMPPYPDPGPPLAPAPVPGLPQGWTLLGTDTFSGVSTTAILLPAGYSRYAFVLQGITVSTSAANISARFSINGGSSYIATGYAQFGNYQTGAANNPYNQTGTSALITIGLSNSAANAVDGMLELFPGNAAQVAVLNGLLAFFSSVPSWTNGFFGNALAASGVVNAVQFNMSAGTMTGTIKLLGQP